MRLKSWNDCTITTKIGTVITLGMVTCIVIILAGLVIFFKKEYLRTIGKELDTSVQAFSMGIDADLSSKLKAISNVASITPPSVLHDHVAAQQFLSNRIGIYAIFDDGLLLLSRDGKVLAELPASPPETAPPDYSRAPFFLQARDQARPFISEPFFSERPGKHPVIEFVAPILDDKEVIGGYLCGGLTLDGNNVLGNMAQRKIGETGHYYIFSKARTILVHPDSGIVMKTDPPTGVNRLFDLAIYGFAGSGETFNFEGTQSLSAFYPLETASWILAACVPTKEIMASFQIPHYLIILTISVCGITVLLLSWWTLFRFMSPLNRFITHLREGNGVFVSRNEGPELTLLTSGFNDMLSRMEQSQGGLTSNEELQRTLLDASPDLVFFKDGEGRWLLANRSVLQLFGLEGVPYQGMKESELLKYTPSFRDTLPSWEQSDEAVWLRRAPMTTYETVVTPDQCNHHFEVTKSPLFTATGQRKAMVVIARDITSRVKDEEQIRQLSRAVEQSPISIVITDTKGNIEFVNPQFTKLTGYTPEEAIGQNARILKTESTPQTTHEQLWKTISSGNVWEGEFYNKTKENVLFIEHAIISPIFDKNHAITHYLAIKTDITKQKQSEEIIWKQANYDSLTQVPNRNLFQDRLKQAISLTAREDLSIAIFFLDLDFFKDVNDSLGHDYGDMLLQQVAERIKGCIRDVDTVARYGGDEFLLLLTNIKNREDIARVADKIIDALQRPFQLNESQASISVSIGISTCPGDTTDMNALLKNADCAMYVAKDAGRNCWRMFSDISHTRG